MFCQNKKILTCMNTHTNTCVQVRGGTVWKWITKIKIPTDKAHHDETRGSKEYWQNLEMKTTTPTKQILFCGTTKKRAFVKISCHLDMNVVRKIQEKGDIYGPSLSRL